MRVRVWVGGCARVRGNDLCVCVNSMSKSFGQVGRYLQYTTICHEITLCAYIHSTHKHTHLCTCVGGSACVRACEGERLPKYVRYFLLLSQNICRQHQAAVKNVGLAKISTTSHQPLWHEVLLPPEPLRVLPPSQPKKSQR